jgi:hypothetical protein
MSEIVTVYTIINPDNKIVAVCSSKELADEAAPTWDDWQGHGSAKVVERQAVRVDDQLFLLANDHGPRVVLDSSEAVQSAATRVKARAKLTEEEAKALGVKK